MILVTGATGKVGSAAVRVLRGGDLPVRAFVRSAAKAQDLAGLGAEIAEGDLESVTSIDAALAGVTSVILVSPELWRRSRT